MNAGSSTVMRVFSSLQQYISSQPSVERTGNSRDNIDVLGVPRQSSERQYSLFDVAHDSFFIQISIYMLHTPMVYGVPEVTPLSMIVRLTSLRP
jgi:hypothetical protein